VGSERPRGVHDARDVRLDEGSQLRADQYGLESGSPKVLRQIKKGISVEKMIAVFGWAREFGIERRGYFIMGLPDETVDDLRLTEQLVERLDPEVFGITIVCPYPGTDLYDPTRHGSVDWAKTDEYSNDFWSTTHLSNADLKGWQRYLVISSATV